ncbi:macrophage colony-stimulating factor 1 isoform X2 [Ochotona curzoniae]|uniref:macrophage colony-stimulating factor 1 isoform X2 n=1 Tax=Ochotona curzoniae TaxID=130825 RepID=UPI001B34EA85|nr:macrophage colony-stimulating factor 1 isoform X2 [Ochotona curzoniae]
MTARGAAGRCPPMTWLGPCMLLVCLLVSRSVTEEVPEVCSHMIASGHLQSLQQLIDSQMETSCQIAFEFVDQEQLKDSVCYLKKAFFLVQDIMEDTLRFKDSTPNAKAIQELQELSLRLKSCYTQDYEENNKACVRTFHETPLSLLEKIKNVFNETKNLLKDNWNIFSKNCNKSFAKCSSQDVVTKPDCNCLYPKATPSSDLASPRQPLPPSTVPMAGLTSGDSEETQGGSLLPGEQALGAVDPGSAKQRPPRSTCQSLESPETTVVEDRPPSHSSKPATGDLTPEGQLILDSAMKTLWALEEASGEADEGRAPGPEENSIQATGPSNLLTKSSTLPAPAKDEELEAAMRTSPARQGSVGSTDQPQNHSPEKTQQLPALPPVRQEPVAPGTLSQGPLSFSKPSAQPWLPRIRPWAGLPLRRQLEVRRSTRDRRSPAELDGAERARKGAAWAPSHLNSLPLTDTGSEPTGSSKPQTQDFAFHLLVPSIILVLLAVGGLLFYKWRWQSHGEPPSSAECPLERPEGSPLTQEEDRQLELSV